MDLRHDDTLLHPTATPAGGIYSKDSLWSKFTSPYDPLPHGCSCRKTRALSPPPGLLQYNRHGKALSPISSREPRSTSLPRQAPSRNLKSVLQTSPGASIPGQRKAKTTMSDAKGHSPLQGSQKKARQTVLTKKLRLSHSDEVLDDRKDDANDISRQSLTMSKSMDELESVKNQWLGRLNQYQIHHSSSRSDETLNTQQPISLGVEGSDSLLVLKGQDDRFDSLGKAKPKNSPREESSPRSFSLEAVHKSVKRTPTCRRKLSLELQKTNSVNNVCFSSPESISTPVKTPVNNHIAGLEYHQQQILDAEAEIKYFTADDNGKRGIDEAKVILVTASDHPQISVRPGISITKCKSCPRSTRRQAATTSGQTNQNHLTVPSRSISFTKEHHHQPHYSCEEVGVCTPMNHRATGFLENGDEDDDDVMLEDIPSMPECMISSLGYKSRSRMKGYIPRNHNRTPPGLPLYSTPSAISKSRHRDINKLGDRGLMHDSGISKASWCPSGELEFHQRGSAGQCLLRHSISMRSKSEERRRPQLLNPGTGSDNAHPFRYSAGASIINDPRIPEVVSEDEFGVCRGVIFDGSTSARTGVFPASLVARRDSNVGGMSGRGKPTVAVKKVSPPTVPDSAALTHRHSGSSFSSGVYSGGDQRSSYSSSVSDENPPPSPRSPARVTGNVGNGGGPGGGGGGSGGGQQLGNNSPSHYNNNSNNNNNNQQQFTFPAGPQQQQVPQFAHLMCPKTSPGSPHHLPPDSTYSYLTYQQQTSLEDQGIDVQSPGRSSPGSGSGSSTTGSTASSGCRNSTTSLDSGRASTTTHSHQHRLSGQSYDSGSILRHSYHSSSSSLGSMEHDNAPHVNVPELLNNGVRDSEVLRVWLTDLRFEEYYDKFITAGYDMPTISRMTPEDLNAIGITKPAHRKKLKAEITRLNISDGLPDFIPGRLEDWLHLLRLDEYAESLRRQQVTAVEQMTQLTWEDLEDIGITKLGHQKKVMLAIKRVKDIMAGKKFNNSQDGRPQSHYGAHDILISRDAGDGRDQFSGVPEFRTFSGPSHYPAGEHTRLNGLPDNQGHFSPHFSSGAQYGPMPPPQAHVHPLAQQPSQFHPPNQYGSSQGPSPPGSKLQSGSQHPLPGPGQVQYRPDVVAVQVRPGGRGMEEPIYGSYQTFHPDSRMPHGQGPPMSLGNMPPRPFPPTTAIGHPHPQRSMDDGDITPTNEYTSNYEGGGTLPRPRTANKLRPVAKVTAKTRVDVHEVPQFIKDGMNLKNPSQGEEICMKELNLKSLNRQNSDKAYNPNQGGGSSNSTPQGTPKKVPPPPPRRSNSISESSKEGTGQEGTYGYLRRGLSYGYMGIKNNLQPDVTPDLPPPPAPPDSANHQHLPDDFPPPPPPLTCVTMASATRISASSTITTSSMTSDSLTTSQTSTTSSDEEVATGFRPRRNDSNASFKSTSSTDSESLPFANENAGTIKQRSCRPHPGLSLDPRASPHASPRASPALRRKDAALPLRHTPGPAPEAPPTQLSGTDTNVSPDGTSDVLSDIGNMLANLTDELDAMLEQEVVIKN